MNEQNTRAGALMWGDSEATWGLDDVARGKAFLALTRQDKTEMWALDCSLGHEWLLFQRQRGARDEAPKEVACWATAEQVIAHRLLRLPLKDWYSKLEKQAEGSQELTTALGDLTDLEAYCVQRARQGAPCVSFQDFCAMAEAGVKLTETEKHRCREAQSVYLDLQSPGSPPSHTIRLMRPGG